jgi:hypothetical protein
MRTSEMIVIALVIASVAVGGVLALVISVPSSPCAGTSGTTHNILIVADTHGFNNSQLQTGSPLVSVNKCDTLKFTILNKDTQPHGFAVDYYAPNGVEVTGGDTVQLPWFVATRSGQFTMRCTIFCTVHNQMIHGVLNVT